MRKIAKKLIYTPIVLALIIASGLIGIAVKANNDILIGGKLWKQGLGDWTNNISVEPGQEFGITHYGVNIGAGAVTSVRLVDILPSNTTYVDNSTFQLASDGVSWSALTDDDTSFFDGAGLSLGTLTPFDFKNYKYSVTVDNFIPHSLSSLSWNGPTLFFTDTSGATSKANMESNSISLTNVPSISSFSLNASTYKLGDTITATAVGTSGKTVYVTIGSLTINLTGSGSNYSGTYTVKAGDSISGTPRVFFDNGGGKGSYRDAASSITIDGIVPPVPANLAASVNQGTLVATLTWTASSPETDVSLYNIYSNGGSGSISYASPFATVTAGTVQYVSAALTADKLYKFVVRAQDAVGNIEQNTNEVNAATDFVAPDPPDSLSRPTTSNDTVLRFNASNPLVFTWASSPSSDVARYRIEIDDNSDFSSIIASLETSNAVPALTATTTQLTLPDDIYYWRALAIDDAELVSTAQTSPDNIFEIDTTAPDSIVYATPTSASHVSGSFTATGTASDSGTHMSVGSSTTGIEKVEVFLQNFSASPVEYWDGSNWVTTQTWLTASTADNFVNWTYSFTASITDGTSYFTGSRVTDQGGNTLDSSLIPLTGNTSSPNVNITAPSNGSYQASTVAVAGTASDPGGTTISDVSISIQRNSDSQYWNGSAWVGAQVWNTASSADNFANWTYNFTPDFSAAENTVYTITAQATDGVFGTPNTGTSSAITTIKDTTAPTVAITSPLAANSPYNATSWDAANPIAGTASDALSGVSGVQVAIQDSSTNYWDGTNWSSATAVWLSATSADNFATWKYINTGSNFIPNKDDNFIVYARGSDGAIDTPNTSAPVSEAITYDTTNPVVTNAVVTNSTVSNITTFIKNGDVFILSATITDLSQSGIGVGNITADLSAITGNAGDTAINPTSYNTSTGEAVWNFGTTAATGNGNLGVTINATDPAGNSVASTNTAIIIADNTAPTIQTTTLTAPSASSIAWAGSSTQTITWTSGDITDANLAANPVTLEYSTDSSNWTSIATAEANDGSFTWTVPSIDFNTVTVRITATDQVANTSNDVSDNQFTIDSTAPTVPANTLTSPNGGEAWKQGTVQTITWNSGSITDNFNLAATPITLEYATSTVWNVIATNEANDGSFSWTTPIIDFTTVQVRITATDAAGNTALDASDATFSIGLPPAFVASRAVSDTVIEVEWDKSLASAGAFANYTATGIIATAAAVNGSNDKIIDLTVNALGNTAFTASDLAIAAGTVTDTFNFQNEAVVGKNITDKQSPVTDIANSYPNSDQLIVDFSPRIRIKVSEAPDIATTDLKLDSVSRSESYNATTGTIEFDVAATLAPGQHTISLDLVDVAGNTESTQTWNFWIDQLKVNVATNPIAYTFSGQLTDEGAVGEQQTVSVESWGVGYTLYARFSSNLQDGSGNSINDVDIKQSSQGWGSKIDLNGTTLVSIATVAKPGTPYGAAQLDTYTLDTRATIPGIFQAAGEYAGTLEFIVIPEY